MKLLSTILFHRSHWAVAVDKVNGVVLQQRRREDRGHWIEQQILCSSRHWAVAVDKANEVVLQQRRVWDRGYWVELLLQNVISGRHWAVAVNKVNEERSFLVGACCMLGRGNRLCGAMLSSTSRKFSPGKCVS